MSANTSDIREATERKVNARRRKRKRLEVYDKVLNVLRTYEAETDHEVYHNTVLFRDCDEVLVFPERFDDGVANALIKHQRFRLDERNGEVVLYRNIY